MNFRLQQTVTHFYSSDVRRPFRSQVQFYLLWLLFACIQLSLLKASEVKKNKIFIEQGRLILTY